MSHYVKAFLQDKNYVILTYSSYIAYNAIVTFYRIIFIILANQDIKQTPSYLKFSFFCININSIMQGLKYIIAISLFFAFCSIKNSKITKNLQININTQKIKFLGIYFFFLSHIVGMGNMAYFYDKDSTVKEIVIGAAIFIGTESFILLLLSAIFLFQFLKQNKS